MSARETILDLQARMAQQRVVEPLIIALLADGNVLFRGALS
jgi:hypothetical protein